MKHLIFLFLVALSFGLNAQIGSIEGIVVDKSTGETLPFATVSFEVDGTLRGAQTDFDGYFEIDQIPNGNYVVDAQYVGYKNQKQTDVAVVGNASKHLLIEMETESIELNELVILGCYGNGYTTNCHTRTICTFPICNTLVSLEETTIPEESEQVSNKIETIPIIVKTYPNPSKGWVEINTDADMENVYVTNTQGKKLLDLGKVTTGKASFDLSPYPTGMYFVNYQYENKTYTEKLILVD